MQYYGTLNDGVTGHLTAGHYSVVRESNDSIGVKTDIAVEFDVEPFHPGWEIVRTRQMTLNSEKSKKKDGNSTSESPELTSESPAPSPPILTTIKHTVVLLKATFDPGDHAYTMKEPVRTAADTAIIAIVGAVQIPLENRMIYCPFDVAVRRCNRRGTPDIMTLVENFVVYDSLWPSLTQPNPEEKMIVKSTSLSPGTPKGEIFGHAAAAIESDKLKVATAVLGLIGASIGAGSFGEASEIIEIVGSSVEVISNGLDIAKDLDRRKVGSKKPHLSEWTLNTPLYLQLHDNLKRCKGVTLTFSSQVYDEDV